MNTINLAETCDELLRDVAACATLESLACGKGMPKPPKARSRRRLGLGRPQQSKAAPFDAHERVNEVVKACRNERRRRDTDDDGGIDDARLSKLARFTDGAALAPYAPFLHFVPRLVNIVRRKTV